MSERNAPSHGRSQLYRLLLPLLQIAILVLYAASDLVQGCRGAFSARLQNLTGRSGSFTAGQRKRGKVPAFPRAIAVVIAEEFSLRESQDDVASFIWWCLELGLSTIQVFEPGGELRAAAAKVRQQVNFRAEPVCEVFVSASRAVNGINTFQAVEMPPLRGEKVENRPLQAGFDDKAWRSDASVSKPGRSGEGEGATTASSLGRTRNVVLLSVLDAVEPLGAAIQAESSKEERGGVHTTEQLLDLIAQSSGDHTILEPSLILVFGPVLTLAGFPPWLARNSEIYGVGRLADVRKSVIQDALGKYLKTSQRFGQ